MKFLNFLKIIYEISQQLFKRNFHNYEIPLLYLSKYLNTQFHIYIYAYVPYFFMLNFKAKMENSIEETTLQVIQIIQKYLKINNKFSIQTVRSIN
jgi:hypothetical protein